MQNALLKLLSIGMWIWFLVSSLLFTPVILLLWVLTFWWDEKLRLVHKFSCFWGAQYIWMNPLWHLDVEGREHIDDNIPSLLISNHQSLVDIVVIYSLFKHFRWTSKEENFRLPFVGWVLGLNRSIRIYRGSASAYKKFRTEAVRTITRGNSIVVFPEGTRSADGTLRMFKEGAFMIARELKIDIIPMVLEGTANAVPKSGWALRGKQRMKLIVLPAVSWEEYKDLSIKEIRQMMQTTIGDELSRIRKENY